MSINTRTSRTDTAVRTGIAARLAEIQARADAATDGPWETRLFDGLPGKKVVGKREPSDLGRGPIVLMQPIFCTEQSADNAEFIAAARTDVPTLTLAVESVLDYVARCEESGITMQPGDVRRLIAAALGGAS